jgi:hypothetical protein
MAPAISDERRQGLQYNTSTEALLPINMQGCPSCHKPWDPASDDDSGQCPSCGYTIPYDGGEVLDGFSENDPVAQAGGAYTMQHKPEDIEALQEEGVVPNDPRYSKSLQKDAGIDIVSGEEPAIEGVKKTVQREKDSVVQLPRASNRRRYTLLSED